MRVEPLISVVIICCNQRDEAVACLRAYLAQQQNYPQSEIIVVDHGSLDNTRQVVLDSFPGLRVISAPGALSRAKASGLGAVMASGHVVAVIDCAALVEQDLFGRLADAYLHALETAPQRLFMSLSVAPQAILQQPAT